MENKVKTPEEMKKWDDKLSLLSCLTLSSVSFLVNYKKIKLYFVETVTKLQASRNANMKNSPFIVQFSLHFTREVEANQLSTDVAPEQVNRQFRILL